MPYDDWREPARLLAVSYGPPSEAQLALAEAAGLDLPLDTPHTIAAALLTDALAPTLVQAPPSPPTRAQLRVLRALGYDWRGAPWKATRRVAAALVVVLVSRRRAQALDELRPVVGDLVGVTRPPHHEDAPPDAPLARPYPPSLVVSSVSASGRVNFRGGSGWAAWPEHVTMLARTADVFPGSAPRHHQPTLFDA